MNTNNLNWNLAYTEILKEKYGKWLSKIDVLKCNKYSELIAACFGLACSDTCTCHCSCLTLPNKWLSWLYCQFIVNVCNSLWCFTVFNLLICLQFFKLVNDLLKANMSQILGSEMFSCQTNTRLESETYPWFAVS